MSAPGDVEDETDKHGDHHSHRLDISGFQLLPRPEFWILFCMLGLLTGVGLMTIK